MMVTASKSSPPSVIMVMNMTTKRSLPILFLTLALVAGSVALAHAPPSQPPVIGTPVINPTSPAFGDAVTVSVNVTSARSTIKNVTITYTTDNWMSTNTTIVATYNATTTTATGRIPAFAAGAHVEYYIIACSKGRYSAGGSCRGRIVSSDDCSVCGLPVIGGVGNGHILDGGTGACHIH